MVFHLFLQTCAKHAHPNKSFSPAFILNHYTLIFFEEVCESLPSHSPDERIFFNLMNLICEIKEMSLIK